jgi:hypothetical protein
VPFSARKTAQPRGALGRVVVVLVSAVAWSELVCPPASAAVPPPTVLPPTTSSLPGSSFQGADGNQNDDAALELIDWQAKQSERSVLHSPDPNEADSAFTNSKENEPGNWDLTTVAGGVTPGKSNIRDAWSSYAVNEAKAFLYLAFTRQDANGATFLTIELNHDSRLWNNGKADIPCRRTDDLLVTYEAQGNDVSVILQRWVTSTTDAATGCAKTGELSYLTTLTPNVDAQGAVNAGPIIARLPGYYSGTVPTERFGEGALNLTQILGEALSNSCFSFGSIWMHSRASNSDSANMEDYVAPREITVRSCAASGTKFHDRNGNGQRDTGEPGLPRWTIWADYNDNGIHDAIEPFAITDSDGQYVINDIRPPDGTYMLRETLPTRRARRLAAIERVTCSFPNASTQGGTATAPGGQFRCAWGPINTAEMTYVRGKDFGNFQAAQLVVKKELEPTTDAGRFHIFVNLGLVLPNAGEGSRRSLMVRPGSYFVAEVAAPGTNPAHYESTVGCKVGTRRRQVRSGTTFENVQLLAGDWTVCTFRNIRPGVPAIEIDKTGPDTADARATLRYTIYVTNPGDLPFPADSVRVTDPNCDAAPQLTGKTDASGSDDSPGTLDPGDTWTYACSHKTSAPADCLPTVVLNTANVTGTTGGVSVSDTVAIETKLFCRPEPPRPTPPTPPGPQPPPPGPPVVPPGPKPPDSGDAAHAGFIFRHATAGCIRKRVPRVNFQGTRIARIQIYVNGQLRRRLTVESLQRRLTPRVQLAPGRYRLSVRVTFDRGTGSPPITLTRRIRICGVLAARPPFTG